MANSTEKALFINQMETARRVNGMKGKEFAG